MNWTDVLVLLRIIEQTKHYPKLKKLHEYANDMLEGIEPDTLIFAGEQVQEEDDGA